MNHEHKAEFAALMTGIAELYKTKISTVLLNIYWRALERFDFADVERAVNAHVNDPKAGQFMVKPADIVRHIEGDNEVRALQAYSKVESAIRHIGSYTSVVFDDPLIHAVVQDMGGWIRFCSVKTEEVPFQTHEFIKRYQGYLQRRPDNFPRHLPGIFDKQQKTLVLIGNQEKAKQIIQAGNDISLIIHREERLPLSHQFKHQNESGDNQKNEDD